MGSGRLPRPLRRAGRWLLQTLPPLRRFLPPPVPPATPEQVELAFQREWAALFVQHEPLVELYWRNYRGLWTIRRLCGFTPETRVLDVACGISTVLHYVQGRKVGVDRLAAEYVRLYRYPPDIRIIAGTAEALPIASESQDVVLCSNALDHIPDPEQAIAEMARVLHPGGWLALTVEVFDRPPATARDAAHPHTLTTAQVEALVAPHFRVEWTRRAPWIGLYNYVRGGGGGETEELILVAQRH